MAIIIASLGIVIASPSCVREELSSSSFTPPPIPEGSVLERSGEWIKSYIGDYQRFKITARVQNIGDDGAFFVRAEIKEGQVSGASSKSTKIYLETGQQDTIVFDFWAQGALTYSVWCSNNP